LTFYPHLSNIESPLEEARLKQGNFRGFMNLIALALVISHVRLMWENYIKYGFMISPVGLVSNLIERNNVIYLSCVGVLCLNVIMLTFFLEVYASKNKKNGIVYIIHFFNLTCLLVFPIYFQRINQVNPSK
jgi:diacylglycerol O-acyltransferase-1